jgi:hypothetical protein
MKQDMYMYWMGGALSMVIGSAVVGGVDFAPNADLFSLVLTLAASFLLMAFGGLLWMIASTRLE